MSNIKTRLAKLEASTPEPAQNSITEIHRIIVGRFNSDGSPCVIVRRIAS